MIVVDDLHVLTEAERVEFHLGIWQCKQVLLACCHDEGYTAFLSPFAAAGRMTLVQNGVCRPHLKALGLPMLRFPGIFVEPLGSDVATPYTTSKTHEYQWAWQGRLGPILYDKSSGMRYDRTLLVPASAVKKIEKGGLCFFFYLTGRCAGCKRSHDHDHKLTVEEFDAIWHIARRGQCYTSQKRKPCTNELCIYGHKA